MARQYVQSPMGLLELQADQRKLRQCKVVERAGEDAPNFITRQAAAELEEYFSGKREQFSVMLFPQGSPFQMEVWNALRKIPFGKVTTYGCLAEAIGQPTASRAVAKALGENPLLIFLPCHRVIGCQNLLGYSAGPEAKNKLLTLEGVKLTGATGAKKTNEPENISTKDI